MVCFPGASDLNMHKQDTTTALCASHNKGSGLRVQHGPTPTRCSHIFFFLKATFIRTHKPGTHIVIAHGGPIKSAAMWRTASPDLSPPISVDNSFCSTPDGRYNTLHMVSISLMSPTAVA